METLEGCSIGNRKQQQNGHAQRRKSWLGGYMHSCSLEQSSGQNGGSLERAHRCIICIYLQYNNDVVWDVTRDTATVPAHDLAHAHQQTNWPLVDSQVDRIRSQISVTIWSVFFIFVEIMHIYRLVHCGKHSIESSKSKRTTVKRSMTNELERMDDLWLTFD